MVYLNVVVCLVGETHSAVESFVWIIVPQTNLQLDCLYEFTRLASSEKIGDGLFEEI
jgi:hypothetical protein